MLRESCSDSSESMVRYYGDLGIPEYLILGLKALCAPASYIMIDDSDNAA